LRDIAGDLADRLVGIWLPGSRWTAARLQRGRALPDRSGWKDNLLFHEYFDGDNGAGLGAMHQTGWTALVADLLLNPTRRTQRLVFHDAIADTPEQRIVAAGPAG
jgi:hypothetical protein